MPWNKPAKVAEVILRCPLRARLRPGRQAPRPVTRIPDRSQAARSASKSEGLAGAGLADHDLDPVARRREPSYHVELLVPKARSLGFNASR